MNVPIASAAYGLKTIHELLGQAGFSPSHVYLKVDEHGFHPVVVRAVKSSTS